MLLRDRGVKLTTQVLGYPFLNFIGFDCAGAGAAAAGRSAETLRRLRGGICPGLQPRAVLPGLQRGTQEGKGGKKAAGTVRDAALNRRRKQCTRPPLHPGFLRI